MNIERSLPVPAAHRGIFRLEDRVTALRPRAASNLLLWTIVAFFVAFVAWATLTELDRTVRGSGRIVPGSQLQVVSNLEGGIVEAILVKAGDVVKRGQPLIRLDPTRTGAELGTNEVTVGALQAKIARLSAEATGRDPAYPASANPAVAEQIAIERSLHAARVADLASAGAAGAARINQWQRAVAEAQATYQSRAAALRSIEQQLGLIRPLVDRGIEPRLQLVTLENSAAVARSDMAAAQAAVARAQASVAEARSALSQVRQDWRTTAASELAAAQADMAAKRRVTPVLADAVRRATVSAPLPGRINRVLVSTVGGSVAPGSPLIELVPSEDRLMVEVQINPKDIGFVRLNQPARINISAYDSAIYGSMDGKVVTISPDAVTDERTGQSFYIVKVEASSSTLKGPHGEALPLGPGMTVEASLLGDKRSVLSYIFTPITRVSERAFRE
jgi:membrane fusion protein, adhesin transport system